MDKKRQKKVTDKQKVLLVSLLENNPRWVSGKFGADFSFDDLIKKWKSIISELESCSTGPKGKSVDDWKRTWSDLKRNVKEKAPKLRSSYRATGGGEASKEKLSELEERIVGIIGETMIERHKRVQEFGSPCVKKKIINICNQPTEIMDPVIQINSEEFILNCEDGIGKVTPNNSLYEQPDVSHSSPAIEDITEDEPLIINNNKMLWFFDFPEMNQQENNFSRKNSKQAKKKTEIDYPMYMEQTLKIETRKAIALETLVITASNILETLKKDK